MIWGIKASQIRKTWQHPELKTLANRLKWHREVLCTFIPTGFQPHNNAAEREIRSAVLIRKTFLKSA
jgi:hypothetical protein